MSRCELKADGRKSRRKTTIETPMPNPRAFTDLRARTNAGEEISFLAGQTVDAVGGLNPILVNPAFYAVAAVSAIPICVR